MSKSSTPPLVAVTWTDSYTHDRGWDSPAEYCSSQAAAHDLIITTVGYLVSRTRERLILSPARDATGKISGVWVIPAGMVKKIRRLR